MRPSRRLKYTKGPANRYIDAPGTASSYFWIALLLGDYFNFCSHFSQAGSLSDFYEVCRGLELARNFQFPNLREVLNLKFFRVHRLFYQVFNSG